MLLQPLPSQYTCRQKNLHIYVHALCSSLTTAALEMCQENPPPHPPGAGGDDDDAAGFSLWLARADRF